MLTSEKSTSLIALGKTMVSTRSASCLEATRGCFSNLPDDVWVVLIDALGITKDAMVAERTNSFLLSKLRTFRSSLKLPRMYDCRSFCIVNQIPGREYSGRYSQESYGDGLIDIVKRYPNLRVLDAINVWDGRMSFFSDDRPLQHLMRDLWVSSVYLLQATAPLLERLIVKPSAGFVPRYFLEVERGVRVEPALSHDTMAFLAAGNAYGLGANSKVKFTVEGEYMTNKAHYYAPVRATTPQGTEFEIWWQERGAGMDDVMLQEQFADECPDSEAFGPDGDDLDYDHPEWTQFCQEQEQQALRGWANDLKADPFALLLGADNGCDSDRGCCKLKLVKKGKDYRLCTCEHKRPVFVTDDKSNDELVCVCSQDLEAY